MREQRVLVVDGNPQVRWVVRNALRPRGYSVTEARSGDEALENLLKEEYDVALLDMRAPGMATLDLPRAIRSCSNSAIIAFIGRDADGDEAEVRKVGADDYLAKPFTKGELLARIRAVLQRNSVPVNAVPDRVSLEGLEINFLCREVRAEGHKSRLTPKEFQLLAYLVTHPNRVIQGRELMRAIWGLDHEDKLECLRVFVNQLRNKIEPERAKPRYLLTEPWVGYRFWMPK